MTEVRFARRKAHTCGGCRRTIDEEQYERTIIPQGTEHRRLFDVLIFCSDCRPSVMAA